MPSSRPFAMLLCSVLLLGCAEELPEEKPRAPDMSATVGLYAAPTARLDQATVSSLEDTIQQQIDQVGSLCGWERLADITCPDGQPCNPCRGFADVLDGLEALNETETPSDGMAASGTAGGMVGDVEVVGDGFVRVTRVCPGPNPAAGVVDAETNGVAVMVAGFTEEGLDPVLFGSFRDCVLGLGGQTATLNLSFGAWVGPGIGTQSFEVTQLNAIIQLDGTIETGGQSREVNFDLRASGAGVATFRLPLNDGYLLANIGAEGVTVEATNGTWTCDFESYECTNPDGEVLSWSP